MGSDSNVWHQVHAQREDGVAAMFLIRDVQPRADQPKIFVVELPYPVTDLSGQPDAPAYRRLSAFQEQWLEPACAALGWTFVAWKCEDGSFFLYLYGAGDPDALLEKLAPFDVELVFHSDVDADWSEYAALRELVEQAEAEGDENGDGDDGDDGDDDGDDDSYDHGEHDHDHHDHHHDHDHAHDHDHDHAHGRAALELATVDLTGEPAAMERAAEAGPAPHGTNGKSRSITAGSEAAAATHRPLPRTVPARTGAAKRAGSTARATDKRAAAGTKPAKRTRPQRAATKSASRAAAKPAKRAAPARPAKPATTKPARRAAATKPARSAAATRPAKRAAAPSTRRPVARPRRSR